MAFLQQQLFTTPKWLVDNTISTYTNENHLTTIGNVQEGVLNRIISHNTLSKLVRFEAEGTNAYTAHEMLTDLQKGIYSELATKKSIDIFRRNLQKAYVERLIKVAVPETTPQAPASPFAAATTISRTNDVISVAKAQLRSLQSQIKAALPAYTDFSSRAHLMDVNDRITAALDVTK
jgi:hypothetical protein